MSVPIQDSVITPPFDTMYSELMSVLLSRPLKQKKKLHGLSPRANYTDRATAACRRSDCQLVRIQGATDPSGRISRFFRQEPLLFYQVAPQLVLTRLSAPRSRPTTFVFFW
jgi:hypothetical protein